MSIAVFVLSTVLVLHLSAAVIATRIIVRRVGEMHPPSGRFVPVSGGHLHVYDRPAREPTAAPPILLLHGATSNARDMIAALCESLTRRHRVIAIDRPGHGWSDRPGGSKDSDPARQGKLIIEALDGLGVSQAVVVVGYSWSGALAAHLALAHADRIAGLVVVAGVTHPWPGGISWHYALVARPVLGTLLAHMLMVPLGAAVFARALAASCAPQLVPDDYAQATAASLILRPSALRWNAQDVAGLASFVARQCPHYGKIRLPTAIIAGEADSTVSPALHAKAMAAQIPGARLTLLPGVGHMPHHVARDALLAAIERVAAESAPLTQSAI